MISNVLVSGGLGNQMFQYAFLIALKNQGWKAQMDISLYNLVEMHNGFELERVFGIHDSYVNRKGLSLLWLRFLLHTHIPCLVKKDTVSYSEDNLLRPRKFMHGVWLSEKYFHHLRDEIISSFIFQNIDSKNLQIAKEMSNCHSVSVHIRRGDYIESGFNTLGEDYYSTAIAYICRIIDRPVFYFFSDDLITAEYIAKKVNIDFTIIDINKKADSYKDMYLMSICQHNIIANSSFSWWGAYLNRNINSIVIAPSQWILGDNLRHPQLDSWVLI